MTFAYQTYSLTRKYLNEYKYYRYFMTKQFSKFLDKKKCKSLLNTILGYDVSIYAEYLTFVYDSTFVSTYGQYCRMNKSIIYDNKIMFRKLSNEIWFHYTTFTEHITILYKIMKDLHKSIMIYSKIVDTHSKTWSEDVGTWRRIYLEPYESLYVTFHKNGNYYFKKNND